MRIILLFLLSSCGPQIIDCTEEERARSAIEISSAFFSSEFEISNMQVVCMEKGAVKYGSTNLHCLIDWFGKSPYGAKIIVEDDIVSECIFHESMHISIFHESNGITVKDSCMNHSPECGWDEDILSQLNSMLPEK